VAKSKLICIKFLPDVAGQKLLKLANAAQSYTKNKSGTFFMDQGVDILDLIWLQITTAGTHLRLK